MKKLNVKNLENYLVSVDGKIYNTINSKGNSQNPKEVKSYPNKNTGYLIIVLQNSRNGIKPKAFYVHRLVAQTYIPNLENKPAVNHKDGNKLNNHISNLEWVTPLENMNHAWETGLVTLENRYNKTDIIRNNKELLNEGLEHYRLYQNLNYVKELWCLKSTHVVEKLLVENGFQEIKDRKYRKVPPYIEQEIKNYFIGIFTKQNNKTFKTSSEYISYIKQKYGIKFSFWVYRRIQLDVRKELQIS